MIRAAVSGHPLIERRWQFSAALGMMGLVTRPAAARALPMALTNPNTALSVLISMFMGLLGGCAPADPGPVQPSLTVTSTAGNGAKDTAETATSSANTPGKEANAGALDAGWVREHPELTRLFTAEHTCSRSEQFLRDIDDSATLHAYELYSPGVAQEDLDRRFRESAHELGYAVRESVTGRGFQDEVKGISAYITDARLTVLFKIPDSLPRAAAPLATTIGFDTWPMLAALTDATWKQIRITRSAEGASLDADLEVGASGRGNIDRWAQAHQFERSAEGWIQKWQPAPAPRAGIAFDFDANKKLIVLESIGQQPSTGACQEHPTRKAKVTPKPSGPPPTDDELMKQMMGN